MNKIISQPFLIGLLLGACFSEKLVGRAEDLITILIGGF